MVHWCTADSFRVTVHIQIALRPYELSAHLVHKIVLELVHWRAHPITWHSIIAEELI